MTSESVNAVGRQLRAILVETAIVLILCLPVTAWAQSTKQDSSAVWGRTDLLLTAGAGVVMLMPTVLLDSRDPVGCVPCDRSTVPFFDRWAIGPERSVATIASDVVWVGVAVLSWLDLADEGPDGRTGVLASVESYLWAQGIVRLTKELVGRKRPVLYTEGGIDVAAIPSNQQSWPSGHASSAAAFATSYWLTRKRISSGGNRKLRVWILAASAVTVGALRVAAAKHFPSDVVSGFAIGATTAVVVHSIKF